MSNEIFISYSHKDQKWLEKIRTVLKPMLREQIIQIWDDTKIRPGKKWREEIQAALDRAGVALLLVSPDFLASDFIAQHELSNLLKSAEQRGLTILWAALRPSLVPPDIEQYQAINDPGKPLSMIDAAKREAVLVEICKKIVAIGNPAYQT